MGFTASNRYTDEGISDYWRLNDVFTVKQAALLIVGCDPASEVGTHSENWQPHERPEGYEAAKQALSSNLLRRVIQGTHYERVDYDMNGNPAGEIEGSTDIDRSTVNRDSVVQWIAGRGIVTGFFQPSRTSEPDYLDPSNSRYAPKLAAAVKAWMALDDENLTRGKSPLQALESWLESRYRELGLIHQIDNEKNKTKAGDINKSAVSEAAKVANWLPGGGAPKTPSAQPSHLPQ